MRLLLDTHVLLWVRADAPLPEGFREAISDPANIKLVSAMSLAEIAVNRADGKLDVPDGFADHVAEIGFDHLAFTERHARVLDTLPLLHRDPFDRMLIAQAIAEDAAFLTVDSNCLQYNARFLRR
ncbi:type II toxin-antitoxin system VapC family toxin [Georgenia sunbinii]|uniref:type II toxin-antitoxin system VapC family toxin n=1 Tax=Georgenia sunbinii TaxID=3117728 RepID=UPI002F26BF1B